MGSNQVMQTKTNDLWQLIEDGAKLDDAASALVSLAYRNGETNSNGGSINNGNGGGINSSVFFMFPPPPRLDRMVLRSSRRTLPAPSWWSDTEDTTTSDSQSDQPELSHSQSEQSAHQSGHKKGGRSPVRVARYRALCAAAASDCSPTQLPPIGVFWDIENCQIPRGKSALTVAQAIRDKFFSGYREAEFVVVCDVKKETPQVIQELNDAQLNLIHVGSTYKNAADEKLRQSMRRFADTHGSSAAIVLISGDVNFAPDLSDLRHRKKIYIILVHNDSCSETLILNADEHHSFQTLVKSLPIRAIDKPTLQCYEVVVSNLPLNRDPSKVRGRLKRLAENCGGRVGYVLGLNTTLRFPSFEFALRAKKRLEGEDVFGSAITVGYPLPVENNSNSPMKSRFGGYRKKAEDTMHYQPAVVQYVAPIPWQSANLSLVGMYGAMPIHAGPPPPPTLAPPHHHSHAPTSSELAHAQTPQLMWDPTAQLAWHSQWHHNHHSNASAPTAPTAPTTNGVAATTATAASQAAGGQQQLVVQQQQQHRGRPILGSNAVEKVNGVIPPGSIWMHNNLHENSSVAVNGGANNKSAEDSSGTAWQSNKLQQSQSQLQQRAQSVSPVTPNVSVPANWQWQNKANHANNANANANSNWNSNKNNAASHGSGGGGGGSNRKCRTPSPFLSSSSNAGHHRSYSPYTHSHSDNERSLNTSSSGPVELQVTNLDQNIDVVEMKKILLSIFQEHVMVLHVSVFVRGGGSVAGVVRVASQQGAHYAISQLHRRKIGSKRIMISLARATSPHHPQVIRSQVGNLLREVPGHQLPLFKFRELFEARYSCSVGASELYRMHDLCTITESNHGRTIALNPEHRSPSPLLLPMPPSANANAQANQLDSSMQQSGVLVCTVHAKTAQCNDEKGWAEQEAPGLPCLRVPLPEFSSRLLALIHSHNNMLPLASLCDCYEAQFGSIALDETGVPLEHLVTCVSGVQIKVSESCAKFLCSTPKSQMADSDKIEELEGCGNGGSGGVKGGTVSPPLAYNLLIFSRELVDLLRNQPRCMLAFNKFIPAYHHHFHRQCRVADYGFTRLIDLFEALPHIVQVMGDGNKKMVTLSHRSQMRRFTCDLLRVLKLQPSKAADVSSGELSQLFDPVKGLDPTHYGLCFVADLLAQITDNTVVVTRDPRPPHHTIVAIPKREQTLEEAERTKAFAQEVVELLSLSRQCTIKFEKFIPAYHHHFGYQCKVADFGFTKLIELFEAIPQVVKIEEDADGERSVSLVNEVKLRVLGEQVADLVQGGGQGGGLPLSALPAAFQWQYGHKLRPQDYHCQTIDELIAKLHNTVKLQELDSGPTLVLVDQKHLRNISLKVWRVLIEAPNGKMCWDDFEKKYRHIYKQMCSLELISSELQDTVNVIREKAVFVQLTSVKLFAYDMYILLCGCEGRLAVSSLEATYERCFGQQLQPLHYKQPNMLALLHAIPQFVILRGKGAKRLVILNKELAVAGISLPPGLIRNPARSNSSSDVENKDQQKTSWPAPPSEALMRSLRFPASKTEEPTPEEVEETENEPKTPQKEWRTTWPNFIKAQESPCKPSFVVELPKFNTPPPPLDSLVSPCKYLLPASGTTPVWPLPLPPLFPPPPPSQLPPPPEMFFEDATNTADASQQGEKNSLLVPSKVDLVQDSEGSCSGSEANTTELASGSGSASANTSINTNANTSGGNSSVRRKLRLAAHFQTPLE